MKQILISLCLIGISQTLCAQLPNSQLYMCSFTQTDDNFNFRDFKYLSSFNPEGYNNQPYFIDNHILWLVSNYYDSEANEIVQLDLRDNTLSRVSKTEEAEYSPNYIPGSDFFSCVRVDSAGRQNLWAYPKNRKDTGANILMGKDKIGYYLWLDSEELLLFELGPPIHLTRIHSKTKEETRVIEDIGRCLKKNADGLVYFIHKLSDEFWFLKSYDPETGNIESLVQTLGMVEDFEILKDGSVIMGVNSTLYRYNPNDNKAWVEIGDFKKMGISKITRMAIWNNKLVFVYEK